MRELLKIQEDYSKKHPNSDVFFIDYFNAFGVDKLINIYNKSNGKEIVFSIEEGIDEVSFKYV